MNIVILGCGKVGQRIAELLSEGNHNITMIDRDRRAVESVTDLYDVIGYVGDGGSAKMMREAGVEKADLVLAMTGDDEVNLISCLIARNLSRCRTIARVRNPLYEDSIRVMAKDLGLAMVVNTERLAAMEAARVIRFPYALAIDTFSKGRVALIKYRVKDGSLLDGTRVSDISRKIHADVLICAVERGDEVLIPNGDLVLKARDAISFATTPDKEHGIFRALQGKDRRSRDVMIIGGSILGFYLAQELLASGIHVTIIERSTEKCEQLCQDLPGANIINADAADRSVLMEEGLENMDVVVTLTDSDETNIILSLYAGKRGTVKTITKMNRLELDGVIEALDLDTILVPKDTAADTVSSYVRAMGNSMGSSSIETLYTLVGGRAEAIEFLVNKGCPLVDIPLAKLNLKSDIVIACISHHGSVEIPNGQSKIREGDNVIVVTTRRNLNDIKDIVNEL